VYTHTPKTHNCIQNEQSKTRAPTLLLTHHPSTPTTTHCRRGRTSTPGTYADKTTMKAKQYSQFKGVKNLPQMMVIVTNMEGKALI